MDFLTAVPYFGIVIVIIINAVIVSRMTIEISEHAEDGEDDEGDS
jgi:hypothetical protein